MQTIIFDEVKSQLPHLFQTPLFRAKLMMNFKKSDL